MKDALKHSFEVLLKNGEYAEAEKLLVPESCTAGKTFMVISPDGMVRKCMHSPEKICSFEEFLTR